LRAVIFFVWGIASVSHFLEPLANSHEQKNESVAIWLYSSKKLLKAHVFYFQRTIFFFRVPCSPHYLKMQPSGLLLVNTPLTNQVFLFVFFHWCNISSSMLSKSKRLKHFFDLLICKVFPQIEFVALSIFPVSSFEKLFPKRLYHTCQCKFP
jgi:hypothetical protein